MLEGGVDLLVGEGIVVVHGVGEYAHAGAFELLLNGLKVRGGSRDPPLPKGFAVGLLESRLLLGTRYARAGAACRRARALPEAAPHRRVRWWGSTVRFRRHGRTGAP